MDTSKLVVARVACWPDDGGPVAVVMQDTRDGEITAHWVGGVWGDGDDVKGYRTVTAALAAIAADVEDYGEEEGLLR